MIPPMNDYEFLEIGNIDLKQRIIIPAKVRSRMGISTEKMLVWDADEDGLFVNCEAFRIELKERGLGTSLIDVKFKTTIPKKIRERLGIASDTRVIWYTDGFNLYLKFATPGEMRRFVEFLTREEEWR